MSGNTNLVPVNRRIVVWEGGVPVVANVPQITKQQVQDTYLAAAALPYEPDPLTPGDEQYRDMPVIEVLIRKHILGAARSGDKDDIESAMDRLVGKPKTSAEVKKMDLSYEDFLAEQARLDKEKAHNAREVFSEREVQSEPEPVSVTSGIEDLL